MDLCKLDTLIAIQVMGWTLCNVAIYPKCGWYENEEWTGLWEITSASRECPGFSPSTEIESAWKVVEKIRDDNFSLEEHGTHWKARFGTHWRGAVTAPLAICLVALDIKGIDTSEWEK